MGFESLFKSGVDKSEEALVIERAIKEVQEKIREKTENPKIAGFFNKKDKQNLQVLESHPKSDLNRTFNYSRDLMHKIMQTPQIIDRRVKFFHPKIG